MKSVKDRDSEEQVRIPEELPILPLRDMVVYPFIIAPLSVAREISIQAVDRALSENRMIMLVAQRDKDEEDPTRKDLFTTGTVAVIMRMLKLPDGQRFMQHYHERAELAPRDIVARAVEEPVRMIAENACIEGSLVVARLRGKKKSTICFNAASMEYEDLMARLEAHGDIEAAAAMTQGPPAGEPTVPRLGPSLPAATTATTKASLAGPPTRWHSFAISWAANATTIPSSAAKTGLSANRILPMTSGSSSSERMHSESQKKSSGGTPTRLTATASHTV